MTVERKGIIQFGGKDAVVVGADIKVGDVAEDFVVQTTEWEDLSVLNATRGKIRILAAVPSLETSVCDIETRTFNQRAAALGDKVVVYVISMDLPFTQKRWCGANGIDRVFVVSDHKYADFGVKYGCLLKDQRVLRRAVFVVDDHDRVVYADYMKEIGVEPDYDKVIECVQSLL